MDNTDCKNITLCRPGSCDNDRCQVRFHTLVFFPLLPFRARRPNNPESVHINLLF